MNANVHAPAANNGLEAMLNDHVRQPEIWTPPEIFDASDPADRAEMERRLRNGEISTVRDPIDEIASELYEWHHPDKQGDATARAAFVDDITAQGANFGKWVQFPWSGELVRYPDRDDHRALRTSRNRDLITAEEQAQLYNKRIVVAGLSVGSNVLEKLVISGIGGELIMGDFDTLSPSNLNRINSPFSNVGIHKVDLAARKISEIDPYLQQVHFKDGITAGNLPEIMGHKPDIIIDEVDSLPVKAQLRAMAREHHVPVIMATDVGDKALVDIERYDLKDADPFNGAVSSLEFEHIRSGDLTQNERASFMLRIVGDHAKGRALDSFMQVGRTLPGLPQLGTTAGMAGSLAALAAREVLLHRHLSSDRYYGPHDLVPTIG